jgi:cephalosporin hydroxylase
VIGASSLGYDAARSEYPAWVSLPYITDPGFDAALREAVARHDVGAIFTPNMVVWDHLNRTLGELIPGIALANGSPADDALRPYRSALAKARHFIADPHTLESATPPRPWPAATELAGLIRYADGIPGMCDDFKLRALVEIARYAVPGDVVEIGSWWGKSAFILASLARCFNIGKLLCVDPWANELLKQDEKLVDSGSRQVDADEALEVFQIGLQPFNQDHINYLRLPSVEAAVRYKNREPVVTEAFGRTDYSGRISLLHIDGNHAYESAKADVAAWSELVVDGGWIIIDDYVWPYGDGPRRAGDEYLHANWGRISTAFVSGTALFIRLTPPVPDERS